MYKTICYGSRIQLPYIRYGKETRQEIKTQRLHFRSYGSSINNNRDITNFRRNIDNNSYILSDKAVDMAGNLRYYGLGAYTGLVALFVVLDKIAFDQNTAIALLAPVAAVIGADYLKHKNNSE